MKDKQILAAAEELNEYLFDPKDTDVIPTDPDDMEAVKEKILEAADLLTEKDDGKISDATMEVIEYLRDGEGENGDGEDEKGEGEDPDEKGEENDLFDAVDSAKTLKDLKTIAKAHKDIFKGLKIDDYEKANDLRDEMLDMIESKEKKAPTKEKEKKNPEKKEKKETGSRQGKSPAIAKAGEPGKPGIIATIVDLVAKSGKKGISKAEILESLKEDFPDRSEQSMKNTINVQVPARINKERFKVVKVGEDRYAKGE